MGSYNFYSGNEKSKKNKTKQDNKCRVVFTNIVRLSNDLKGYGPDQIQGHHWITREKNHKSYYTTVTTEILLKIFKRYNLDFEMTLSDCLVKSKVTNWID